jgi:electron transport complex protein RnfD
MAMRLMIMPSARTKFLKHENMKLILKLLIVLAAFMVVGNYFVYSFMHAVKLILMIYLSVIVTREVEILFYSFDKEIDRGQAKELIEKSYYIHTALIYALIVPVGTPLWLVVIGAVMATFLGKLMFGGYHHMVFHSSLVGYLFVTLGWTGLAVDHVFINSFFNNVLKFLFDNDFFNVTLGVNGLFEQGLIENIYMYALGGLILLMFVFLVVKKALNYIAPVSFLGTFLVLSFIVGTVNGFGDLFAVEQLFTGVLLLVVVFVVSNPITTPIPTVGKVIYGILAAVLTVFIRLGGTYTEGVVFGVLFMSMLTPMLNVELGKKKKLPKKDPVPQKKVVE